MGGDDSRSVGGWNACSARVSWIAECLPAVAELQDRFVQVAERDWRAVIPGGLGDVLARELLQLLQRGALQPLPDFTLNSRAIVQPRMLMKLVSTN